MPFVKTGPNSYVSPSGRHFTAAQVRLYYASGGFNKKKLSTLRRLHKARRK